MKSADLFRELLREDWVACRVRGQRRVFRHVAHAGSVVVPHQKQGLGTGLVRKIRAQARLIE